MDAAGHRGAIPGLALPPDGATLLSAAACVGRQGWGRCRRHPLCGQRRWPVVPRPPPSSPVTHGTRAGRHRLWTALPFPRSIGGTRGIPPARLGRLGRWVRDHSRAPRTLLCGLHCAGCRAGRPTWPPSQPLSPRTGGPTIGGGERPRRHGHGRHQQRWRRQRWQKRRHGWWHCRWGAPPARSPRQARGGAAAARGRGARGQRQRPPPRAWRTEH